WAAINLEASGCGRRRGAAFREVRALPIESEDGAFVYFVEASPDMPGPLWQLPVSGVEPVKLLDSVIASSYDVVKSGIYDLERVSSDDRLMYFDLSTRRSILIAQNLGKVVDGLSASRDGRMILFSRVDSSVNDTMLLENLR